MSQVKRREYFPVGNMVLISHDEDTDVTKGGIVLPDSAKQLAMTGLIVRIPEKMDADKIEYPFEELDRVIYDIRERIPCELASSNKLFFVEYTKILGIVRESQ